MRFRLDSPHVINDMQLDAGTEIGDDTPYVLRDSENKFTVVPSAAMTPLDDEATKLYGDMREEKRKNGITWGHPLENIPIRGAGASPPVIGSSINRNAQPIIPAPIEHLIRPNNMRPNEVGDRQNPLIEEALKKQNEQMAKEDEEKAAKDAERDKREAEKSNAKQQAEQKDRLAVAGKSAPQGLAPNPPPSTQVPRSSGPLTPEGDGQRVEPDKKDKK